MRHHFGAVHLISFSNGPKMHKRRGSVYKCVAVSEGNSCFISESQCILHGRSSCYSWPLLWRPTHHGCSTSPTQDISYHSRAFSRRDNHRPVLSLFLSFHRLSSLSHSRRGWSRRKRCLLECNCSGKGRTHSSYHPSDMEVRNPT